MLVVLAGGCSAFPTTQVTALRTPRFGARADRKVNPHPRPPPHAAVPRQVRARRVPDVPFSTIGAEFRASRLAPPPVPRVHALRSSPTWPGPGGPVARWSPSMIRRVAGGFTTMQRTTICPPHPGQAKPSTARATLRFQRGHPGRSPDWRAPGARGPRGARRIRRARRRSRRCHRSIRF